MALGDQGEQVDLVVAELGQRASVAGATHEARDDGGVDDALALGDPADGIAKHRDVGDPVLEQVADALGVCLEQTHRIARVEVLREHEDAHIGVVPADRLRGDEALVGVRRRHLDVGDRDRRSLGVDGAQQLLRIRGSRDDLEARVPEQASDSLAEQERVVGDDDPVGAARPRGRLPRHNFVETLGAADALELALAEVAQLETRKRVVAEEPVRRPGDEDLPAARDRHDPRGPVHRQAEVAALGGLGLPGVDADAHPDVGAVGPVVLRERPLSVERSPHGLLRVCEREEERLALRVDLVPGMRREGVPQQPLMAAHHVRPPLAERARELRRALHVGEEKRDRSARQVAHEARR